MAIKYGEFDYALVDGPLAFFTKCLVCHMVKKVILIKCFSKK
jgi:hypothetical protein